MSARSRARVSNPRTPCRVRVRRGGSTRGHDEQRAAPLLDHTGVACGFLSSRHYPAPPPSRRPDTCARGSATRRLQGAQVLVCVVRLSSADIRPFRASRASSPVARVCLCRATKEPLVPADPFSHLVRPPGQTWWVRATTIPSRRRRSSRTKVSRKTKLACAPPCICTDHMAQSSAALNTDGFTSS